MLPCLSLHATELGMYGCSGFDFATYDSYFMILAKFMDHISAENSSFRNHIE